MNMDLWPQIQAALENKIHSYGLQYDTIIMHEIRRNISNEVSQSVMENTVRYVLHDNTADFCSWIYAHLPPPCGANLTDYQVLAIERGHVGRRIIAVLDSPDSDTVPERMLDSGSEEIDPNALESSDDNVQANSPVPVPADANVNMVEAEAEEEVMGEAEAEEEVMGEAEAEEEAMGEAEAEEEAMGEAEDDSDYEMEEFEDTTGSDSGDDENGEEDDSDDPDAAHLPAIDASSTENTTAEPTASVAQPEQAEFALDAMARRSRSRSPLARSKTPKRSSQDDEDVKDTTVEAESPSKQIRKRHRDFDNGVLQVNTARSPRRVIPAEEELEETGFLVRVGDGPSRRFLTDDGPPGDENFAAIKRRRRLDNPAHTNAISNQWDGKIEIDDEEDDSAGAEGDAVGTAAIPPTSAAEQVTDGAATTENTTSETVVNDTSATQPEQPEVAMDAEAAPATQEEGGAPAAPKPDVMLTPVVPNAPPIRSLSTAAMASIMCRFGARCHNEGCGYRHPKKCRYDEVCTNEQCYFWHPKKNAHRVSAITE